MMMLVAWSMEGFATEFIFHGIVSTYCGSSMRYVAHNAAAALGSFQELTVAAAADLFGFDQAARAATSTTAPHQQSSSISFVGAFIAFVTAGSTFAAGRRWWR
jgi:hypothetical protein